MSFSHLWVTGIQVNLKRIEAIWNEIELIREVVNCNLFHRLDCNGKPYEVVSASQGKSVDRKASADRNERVVPFVYAVRRVSVVERFYTQVHRAL